MDISCLRFLKAPKGIISRNLFGTRVPRLARGTLVASLLSMCVSNAALAETNADFPFSTSNTERVVANAIIDNSPNANEEWKPLDIPLYPMRCSNDGGKYTSEYGLFEPPNWLKYPFRSPPNSTLPPYNNSRLTADHSLGLP